MKIHHIFYCLFAFIWAIPSCNKEKKCSKNSEEIPLYAEKKTVVVGWPIKLSTPADDYDQYDYHWKGPHVDLLKPETDNQPNVYVKESADFSDAGTYSVEVIDGKCIKKRGTVQITVIDPPSEPCTVQNNYATPTIVLGVGGVTYTSIQEYTQFPPVYFIEATSGPSTALTFTFRNGGVQPKLGVYKSNGQSSPDGEDQEELSVTINSGFYEFVMKAGFEVYVTRVNGKLHLAFCDAEFDNPLSNDQLILSGSITLP
ncbi:hypothetical protein [Fluviicola chungangensis]|uniref:Uncharacterized protein n=1 Tax=Fluviicola chungangensis TaxID=2597671 RepID=A0A556N5W3_9FLAO|nr:hypothetical protein [Fluviicola chungangensis]TSJ47580.1 hypothetical protein FO442_00185 [Fluviicola chungangensis]